MNIRKNDLVVIVSGKGKPRNKTPEAVTPRKVLLCYPEEGKVIVEQSNYIWKHVRRSDKYPQGGRIQKEAPIHVSNIMLWCENCSKPVKVKIERTPKEIKGRMRDMKQRLCKKCGTVIEPRKK